MVTPDEQGDPKMIAATQVLVNPFLTLTPGERSMLAKVVARLEALDRDLDVTDINGYVSRVAEIYVTKRAMQTNSNFVKDVAAGFRRYGRLTERQALAIVRNIHRDRDLIDVLVDLPDEQGETFELELPEVTLQPKVANGYYTVVMGDGTHVTLRLRSYPKAGVGAQRIAYLYGSNNESDYVNFGTVRGTDLRTFNEFVSYDRQIAAAKTLLGLDNSEEAGKRFALESQRCYKCGRTLTDPTSIAFLIGPECRNK